MSSGYPLVSRGIYHFPLALPLDFPLVLRVHVRVRAVPILVVFKTNATSKSRIDYWLGSDILSSYATKCSISGAPLTDHSVINLILEQNKKSSKTKGYWNFNADLLNHDDFCAYIKKIIAEFKVKNAV